MWAEAERIRAPVADFPPPWASAFGDDEYGLWADLTVGKPAVTQRLRWIEPGEFTMGSSPDERARIDDKDYRRWADEREAPAHLVRITRGFWLADTPCTQALWLAVIAGKNPSHFAKAPDAALRPVEQVGWDDADRFMGALAEQLTEGRPALPTEAEWEYACRAGTGTAYFWGDDFDQRRANVGGEAGGTTPVKRYACNAWGLYDMHGNVWEWCADAPRRYSARPEADPQGGAEGDVRVLRGGAWVLLAACARSAFRFHDLRDSRWHDCGFRLALRSPSPDQGPGGPALPAPGGPGAAAPGGRPKIRKNQGAS